MECPDDLYNALVSTWDQNPQYVDLCDIIVNNLDDEGGEVGEEQDDEDSQDPTFVHTFYRYVLRDACEAKTRSTRQQAVRGIAPTRLPIDAAGGTRQSLLRIGTSNDDRRGCRRCRRRCCGSAVPCLPARRLTVGRK